MSLSDIDLVNSGNIVIAEWKSQGTNTSIFNGYKPTGKTVNYTGITIFQFECQKVVRYKCIINMLDIYEQLGFFLQQESYDGQRLARLNHSLLLSKLRGLTSEANLSARELECISFFIHGWSAKQIGSHVDCSYRTIQNHISNAMDKLEWLCDLYSNHGANNSAGHVRNPWKKLKADLIKSLSQNTYHLSPLKVASITLEKCSKKLKKLCDRGSTQQKIERYIKHWILWAEGGVRDRLQLPEFIRQGGAYACSAPP